MKNYKIFTEDEFKERVNLFWNSMIKSEFPEWDCVPIEISKRLTKTFGKVSYSRIKIEDGIRTKLIPKCLKFAYRLLDGRYTLDEVDDTIKHEITHHIDVLRNHKSNGHNEKWEEIAREFGVKTDQATFGEESELYDNRINCEKDYRYFIVCESCGLLVKYKTKARMVRYIYNKKTTKGVCKCSKCTTAPILYYFKNGIEAGTEVNYEAYYNLYGGKKIV